MVTSLYQTARTVQLSVCAGLEMVQNVMIVAIWWLLLTQCSFSVCMQ